ncbi:hypothetical protein NQ314_021413 [Rhamnusium bicolor]|uniref:Uncharacterized protein n=1 Tax=Rhamnusium bicolor TaxID=1586634 RepID=A0AAV8WJ42_9CUCU|nr:hypothetical protein NQ314_021413 [Rhamnusium bicolor]
MYDTPPSRKSALSIETKILTALHFYGHGTYQEGVGKNIFSGVSQASVSRSINEVTNALNSEEVKRRLIKFPQNINELQELRTRYLE